LLDTHGERRNTRNTAQGGRGGSAAAANATHVKHLRVAQRAFKACNNLLKANLNRSKMDFSEQTPEEKLKLSQVLSGAGKVITAAAPFVPALQPVAAVIGALKK
jgi:hypothetical protein